MTAAPTISAKAKERPILFSAPMVKAILAGTKSQTRRIANVTAKGVLSPYQRKLQFEFNADKAFAGDLSWLGVIGGDADCVKEQQKYQQLNVPIRHPEDANIDWPDCGCNRIYCPYGQPGDRLWVKETWGYNGCFSGGEKCEFGAYVTYHADGTKRTIPFPSFEEMMAATPAQNIKTPAGEEDLDRFTQQARRSDRISEWWRRSKKRPSIFMPRWASRLTLEIVAVRVERLWAISEADAKAEGVAMKKYKPRTWIKQPDSYRDAYMELWDEINGKGAWQANPFVWVVEFKRLTP